MAKVSAKSSSSRYQPFSELFVTWGGRGELKTLKTADLGRQWPLLGKASVCGLYMNELLLYLLGKELPSPELYEMYSDALTALQRNQEELAATLRRFEKHLLEELGYLPPLYLDEASGDSLYFSPSQGISVKAFPDSFAVSAASVQALAEDRFYQKVFAKEIKLMLAACIDRLLNGKPLRSRELIRSMSKKHP